MASANLFAAVQVFVGRAVSGAADSAAGWSLVTLAEGVFISRGTRRVLLNEEHTSHGDLLA